MMARQVSEEERAHIHEIKDVLYGNFIVGEDKRLVVSRGVLGNPWGLTDGAPEAFLFGVMRRQFVYEAPARDRIRLHFEAGKTLGKVGRSLFLATAPNDPACLMKHVIFRPVVFTLSQQPAADGGQDTVLTAYSSRSLFSLLSILWSVKAFERHLPKQLRRRGTEAREDGRADKAKKAGR